MEGLPEWEQLSNCRFTDPEVFFPEKGASTQPAKRICARCMVQPECLQQALDRDERFGVWGGASERERRKLKGRSVGPWKRGKRPSKKVLPDSPPSV